MQVEKFIQAARCNSGEELVLSFQLASLRLGDYDGRLSRQTCRSIKKNSLRIAIPFHMTQSLRGSNERTDDDAKTTSPGRRQYLQKKQTSCENTRFTQTRAVDLLHPEEPEGSVRLPSATR
jgi:hypothetical protein